MTKLSRRAFLRGRTQARSIQRPPWTNTTFTEACIGCGDCVSTCPQQVLRLGDKGLPEISFQHEGCSLCGQCAEVCQQPVFDQLRPAFSWRVALEDRCLTLSGVDCQSCRDACEPQAIRFRPALRQAPQILLMLDECTGCGACLPVCPVNALTLEPLHD